MDCWTRCGRTGSVDSIVRKVDKVASSTGEGVTSGWVIPSNTLGVNIGEAVFGVNGGICTRHSFCTCSKGIKHGIVRVISRRETDVVNCSGLGERSRWKARLASASIVD